MAPLPEELWMGRFTVARSFLKSTQGAMTKTKARAQILVIGKTEVR